MRESLTSGQRLLIAMLGALLPMVACGGKAVIDGGNAGSSNGGSGATSGGPSGGGSSSSGGSGGAGLCPAEQPSHTDYCDTPELLCSYGSGCCGCRDISCAIMWLCADPQSNDAACQAQPPTGSCATDLLCEYCIAGAPAFMLCHDGQWSDSIPVGCM